ncbi:hypothetical protein [Actinoallomurus sp. NPDC052274]|uniref:hypothetical protein n=1 Tax=Actinoallomurus sp. NPDC052274 TaxID=3155420 RepID=UPI00342A8AB6
MRLVMLNDTTTAKDTAAAIEHVEALDAKETLLRKELGNVQRVKTLATWAALGKIGESFAEDFYLQTKRQADALVEAANAAERKLLGRRKLIDRLRFWR